MAQYYERIAEPGVPINGDIEANGVLIPQGNLPHFSQGELLAYGLRRVDAEDAPPRAGTLSKRILLQRLHSVGLFDYALMALGGPGAYAYERWSASTYVNTSHPDVLAIIGAIGGDPTFLLAPATVEEENS